MEFIGLLSIFIVSCGAAYERASGNCDPSTEFTCQTGHCIPLTKYNNTVNDCGDNSDEVNFPCRFPAFSCKNNRCVVREWVLDGTDDCGDGTDEAKVIGSDCTMILDCCHCHTYVTHSECNAGVCNCIPGFLVNELGTTCTRRKIGSACDTDGDCFNAFPNGVCANGVCGCDTGYYVNETNTGCTRRVVGDDCSSNPDCDAVIPNSNCTDDICMCNPGFMEIDDGSECKQRVLDDPCEQPHDCSAAVANSACQKDSESLRQQCLCADGYIRDREGGCRFRRIGERCGTSSDCKVNGSQCEDNICRCKKGLLEDPDRMQCHPRKIGQRCLDSEDCAASVKDSVCDYYRHCVCILDYYPSFDRLSCIDPDKDDVPIIATSVFVISGLAFANILLLGLLINHFVL